MMPYGVPIPSAMKKLLLEQTVQVANQVEHGLQDELAALAKQFNVTMADKPVEGTASASWVEEQGARSMLSSITAGSQISFASRSPMSTAILVQTR